MRFRFSCALALALIVGASVLPVSPARAQASSGGSDASATGGGPIRLRQPQQGAGQASPRTGQRLGSDENLDLLTEVELERMRAERLRPGEFEAYIQRITNDARVRRFGANLVLDEALGRRPLGDAEPQVPENYRLGPGDEIMVSIWGGVDADLRLRVDRAGRVNIPRFGIAGVAGLTLPEATAAIERQGRRTFKAFELSVTLSELRQIRVFVTGFAQRPGAYTVSSLTTLSSVLLTRAGGPDPSGSFRQIELRRAGRTLAKLDLYDLLLHGKRDADHGLQADDVIHVGPVGRQVAVIGSVNKPAVFELTQGETVADSLQMAGGLNSVADRSRLAVERLSERNARRIQELQLPQDSGVKLDAGDVVRAFSAIDATLPLERQNKRVRIEGEVQRPGTYILPPSSSVADALKAAGGLTPAAYLFGAEFYRETVRQNQQTNYERALRDLELELSRRASASATRTGEEAAAQNQQQQSAERFIARLREARPTGRVVLQLAPNAKELPDLALEDGDRLMIPALPTTVGVFGSVFNTGSYLYNDGRKVDDYIRLAGSPTRGADRQSIFVIRANGGVISAQQQPGTWFSSGSSKLEDQLALPGDTIFVPEEANKVTFLQAAKDWTQVLYQLGLGLASVVAVTR